MRDMRLAELDRIIVLREDYANAVKEVEKMGCVSSVTVFFSGHSSLDLRRESADVDRIRELLVATAERKRDQIAEELGNMGIVV